MSTVIEAFSLVLQTDVLIAILLSSIYGLVVGSLPGLSATMATALLVPVTFYLSPIAAVATIIAASAMAIFSGDIPGALLRIPGTPGLRRLHRRSLRHDAQGPAGDGARHLRVVQRARRHCRHDLADGRWRRRWPRWRSTSRPTNISGWPSSA